ncbi:hypothetical protein FRC05_008277 [Tulasnella sp. 425]|nr:hypothetical protein FRC05_008277 [Tulasnella sp. 425]
MVEFKDPPNPEGGLVFDPPRIRLNYGQQDFTFQITNNLRHSFLFKWTILQYCDSVESPEPPLYEYGVVGSNQKGTVRVKVPWTVDKQIHDYQHDAICVEGVWFGEEIEPDAYEHIFKDAIDSSTRIYSWLLYFLHLPVKSNGLVDVVKPEPEADGGIVNWIGKAPPKTDQWYAFQTTNNPNNAYGFWKIPRANIPVKLGSYLQEQCSDEARAFILTLSMNFPEDLSIPRLAVDGEYEAVMNCIEGYQREKDSIKLESTSRNGVWVCKIRFPGNAAITDMVVKQVRGMSPFDDAFGESARLLSTRAIKELSNTSKTLHDNVVRLVGFTMQGVMAYVLPYYEEGSVTGYIQRCIDSGGDDPLKFAPLALRIKVIKDITLGLQYIHLTLGFIHGDLKFNNVLVRRIHGEMFGVRAIIIDFGFSMSALLDNRSDEERKAKILGVARYWAPELFYGGLKEMLKTLETDIFALACLIAEIAFGIVLFNLAKRRPTLQLVEAVSRSLPNPETTDNWKPVPTDPGLSKHIPTTSKFWNLTDRCLDNDPENRFTITECLEVVKRVEQEPAWMPEPHWLPQVTLAS